MLIIGKKMLENTQNTNSLPKVIQELINNDFDVIINKSGYLVKGFYGNNPRNSTFINSDDYVGSLLIRVENSGTYGYDFKGKKHLLNNFEDVIKLNHHIWKNFIKDEQYKKVDEHWFKFLYSYGLLEINPKK